MYGLPTDTVRKRFRTKTIPNNGINPVWDEDTFVFKKVVLPDLATVRIVAYEESSKSILGHRVLPLVGLCPGYKHIALRNERGQGLGLSTLFVHIKVGDYVPDGLSDFAEALANPIKYQNAIEKRSHQLEVFEDDDEKVQFAWPFKSRFGVYHFMSLDRRRQKGIRRACGKRSVSTKA